MIANNLMEHYYEYNVSAELSPFISCIWSEDYFNQYLNKNKPQVILPDDSIELIFTKSAFYRKSIYSDSEKEYKTHICGLKSKSQIIRLNESPVLSVRFKPYGLYYFTRFPMSHVVNQSLDPRDLFGSDFEDIENLVLGNTPLKNKLVEIEKYLKRKLFMMDKSMNNEVHNFVDNPDKRKITREFYSQFEEIIGFTPLEYSSVKNSVTSYKNHIQERLTIFQSSNNSIDDMETSFCLKVEELLKKDLGIQKPVYTF